MPTPPPSPQPRAGADRRARGRWIGAGLVVSGALLAAAWWGLTPSTGPVVPDAEGPVAAEASPPARSPARRPARAPRPVADPPPDDDPRAGWVACAMPSRATEIRPGVQARVQGPRPGPGVSPWQLVRVQAEVGDGVVWLDPAPVAAALGARARHEAREALAEDLPEGAPLPELPEDAVLEVSPGSWETWIRLDGHTDATAQLSVAVGPDQTLSWDCTVEDPPEEKLQIGGRVVTEAGLAAGRVFVRGCGAWTRADRDGGFFLMVDPEPCTLRAMRRDGVFTMRSRPVPVDPTDGREILLEMGLPDFPAAGVGVSLAEDPQGFRVRQVFDDSPAQDAGLRSGDLIVAADGVDAVDFDTWSFIDFVLGPPDTEVTYTVLRDGREVDVVMVREVREAEEG